MFITLDEGAKVPKKATRNSAGYDLFSLEEGVIPPGSYKKFNTGVHMEIPQGIVGTISHRSGMNSKQGVQAFGQIDPDFRGAVAVTLFNADPAKEVRVSKGDRIAQFVLVQIWNPVLSVVESLAPSERGTSGHGSTGR